MPDEPRPAVDVFHDAADAAGSPVSCNDTDCRFCQAAAAVIKADREAVRASLLAENERLREALRNIDAWGDEWAASKARATLGERQ